jgi:pyridoxal phosphate phosphatase PHOSPHO2
MIDLYKEGKTKEQVLDALRILPFVRTAVIGRDATRTPSPTLKTFLPTLQHPAMKRAVTELQQRDPNTTFICLSNSNTVYINTILEVRSTPPS